MSDKVEVLDLGSATSRRRFAEIRNVYSEVYSEPPYFYGDDDVEEFERRFDEQSRSSGFRFFAAADQGTIVGFSYTILFGPSSWWNGALTEPPPEIKDATNLAVIELILRKEYRGAGIGGALMDSALEQDSTTWATLLVNPDAPAFQMYLKWGWRDRGGVQAQPAWPVSRALALDLTTRTRRHNRAVNTYGDAGVDTAVDDDLQQWHTERRD